MKEPPDRIEKAAQEKAYFVSVLQLWAHARKCGYEPEQIEAFTFKESFLTWRQAPDNNACKRRTGKPKYSGETHYNALRLVDGSLAKITLIERPKKPEWMD